MKLMSVLVAALIAVVVVLVVVTITRSRSTLETFATKRVRVLPRNAVGDLSLPEADCDRLFTKTEDKTKCVTAVKAFNHLATGTKTPETALQAFQASARSLVAMNPVAVAAAVTKNSNGKACIPPDVRPQTKALTKALLGALEEVPAIIKWTEKVTDLLPTCKTQTGGGGCPPFSAM